METSATTDYLWGRNIGEGSFSRVVHARRKLAPEHLAIKIMEKLFIVHNNKVEHVKQEKSILVRLSGSAWVIRLLAAFQDADNVYMVMPLAHGGNLLQLINRRREAASARGAEDAALSHPDARFYFAEIVAALRYLHSERVVHRDLKPENILIMGDGHLRLSDFGTALDLRGNGGADSGVSDFVGTPEYVSPEVLRDEPATAAADLWGVGVILFQLLSGRLPFSAPSEWLIFDAILAHCSGERPLVCPASFDDHLDDGHGGESENDGSRSRSAAAAAAAAEQEGGVEDEARKEGGSMVSALVQGLLRPVVAERFDLAAVAAHPWLRRGGFFDPDLKVPPRPPPPPPLPLENITDADDGNDGNENKSNDYENDDGKDDDSPVVTPASPVTAVEEASYGQEAEVAEAEAKAEAEQEKTSRQLAALQDVALRATDPPFVPGDDESIVQDRLQEFSKEWLFESEDAEGASSIALEVIGSTAPAAASPTTREAAASPLLPSPLPARAPAPPLESFPGATPYERFCRPGERIYHMGATWKRKGLFSKHRMLLLTNTPRLLSDPMELKGEVGWSDEQPVEVASIDGRHFDVISSSDKDRAYHFMVDNDADSSGGSGGSGGGGARQTAAATQKKSVAAWVDAINQAVEAQRLKVLARGARARAIEAEGGKRYPADGIPVLKRDFS